MKKILSITMTAVMSVMICLLCVGCSNLSGPEGNWECDSVTSGYPDVVTLNNDGTGTLDAIDVSWVIDGEKIRFTSTWNTYKYDFKLEDDKLYLDDYSYHRR